jgi:hypothetical protein
MKCPDYAAILDVFAPIVKSNISSIMNLVLGNIAIYSEEYPTKLWSLHGKKLFF